MKEFIETKMERKPICFGCGTNADNQTDCCSNIEPLKRNVELYSQELFRLNKEIYEIFNDLQKQELPCLEYEKPCGRCTNCEMTKFIRGFIVRHRKK